MQTRKLKSWKPTPVLEYFYLSLSNYHSNSLDIRLMQYLATLDLFGVPLFLKSGKSETTYKTTFGGILTIIIYTLSLLYAIYVFQDWTQNNLLPKISSQRVALTDIDLVKSEEFFSLTFQDVTHKLFQERENILTPFLITMKNKTFSVETFFSNSTTLHLSGLNLSMQADASEQIFQFLLLAPCQQKFLSGGQTCAPEETIKRLMSEVYSVLRLEVKLDQYDSKANQLYEISKQSFQVIEPKSVQYTQIRLSTAEVIYDDGPIFENLSSETLISDYLMVQQEVSSDFSNQFFRDNYFPVSVILFQVDNLRVVNRVVKPKLGEVLAQIGSIVSVLMMMGVGAQLLNQELMNQEVASIILSSMFDKYKEITITRGCFGRIQKVTWNERALDVEKFRQKLKEIDPIIQKYQQLPFVIAKLIELEKRMRDVRTFTLSHKNEDSKDSKINQVNDEEALISQEGADLKNIFGLF